MSKIPNMKRTSDTEILVREDGDGVFSPCNPRE